MREKTTEEILRVNGEVELIANRARWVIGANMNQTSSHGFLTKEQEVEHQMSILDALCLNYLQARGKL